MKTVLRCLLPVVAVGFLLYIPAAAAETPITDFKSFFAGYNASFILYDRSQDTYLTHNKPQSEKRLTPCSTFKIMNSLIGLETGVIRDADFVIPWDGETRNIKELNRDHSLSSAFSFSVVWYYQELARRVGTANMKKYIDAAGYGNNDLSGPIDEFWLMNSIAISAAEQVELLKKLHDGALPFSARSMDIVKNIMILQKNDAYVLRGKTGSGVRREGYRLGWFVGYLEYPDNAVFFAVNIEDTNTANGVRAKEICLDILRNLGYIK